MVIIWDNNYAAAVFLEELYFFVPVCCVGRCLFSFCNKAVWYYIEIEGMKRQGSKGMVLYEQVLQKNFEIIQTFLNKFPLIFKKQDHFEESLKKMAERVFKQEQEQEKLREELQLTTNLLERKITNYRESNAKNSRSSARMSQEFIPLEERKNSIFRVSSAFKQQRDSQLSSLSKDRSQMLAEMDKRLQEHTKTVEEMLAKIQTLQEKMNFLSVLQSKNEEKLDKLGEEKVNTSAFADLSSQFHGQFCASIAKIVEEKYHLGGQLIDRKVAFMEQTLASQIDSFSSKLKKELLVELSKKTGLEEFKGQLGEIREVIEKMVVESVESFASKEETKKALVLFEKKIIKLELVLEELLSEALKRQPEDAAFHCVTLPARKEREVMQSFGKKKKIER